MNRNVKPNSSITRPYTLITKNSTEYTVHTTTLAEAQGIFKEKYPVSQMLRIKDQHGQVVWRHSHL